MEALNRWKCRRRYLSYSSSFLVYFLAINFIYIWLLVLAFSGSVKRVVEAKYTNFQLIASSHLTVPISVIIPAYNEEVSILNAVYSSLGLHYPEYEVIVINDGSTDSTLKVLIDEFELTPEDMFYRIEIKTKPITGIFRSKRYPNLLVIDKENEGKAEAINAGVNLSRYRYIVMTDADSIFDHEGILRISRRVNIDPSHIVAVGGQLRIANGLKVEKGEIVSKRLPERLVTKFQVVEYLGSFLGNRVGWSEINSVLVISGGYGLWRKDVFIELGGMTSETTHEDIEFTFRLHEHYRKNKMHYRIEFLPDPIVFTEAPETWRGVFVQRRRWQRVVNEVAWKYRRMFLRPRYGTVGMIGVPYMVIFETFGPFFELGSYLLVTATFIAGLLPLNLLLTFLLVSFGLTSVVRIASVFIEQYSFRTYSIRSLPILFLLSLLENFGYHQYIAVARLYAFFDVLLGRKQWERIPRKGFETEKSGH